MALIAGRFRSPQEQAAIEGEASVMPASWTVQVLHDATAALPTEIIVVMPGIGTASQTFRDSSPGAIRAFLRGKRSKYTLGQDNA